jgi:hypothetical protein
MKKIEAFLIYTVACVVAFLVTFTVTLGALDVFWDMLI